MERIFWAECPHCRGSFYCNYGELRHAGVKLECPFCAAKFLPDEARSLDERDAAPDAAHTDKPHTARPDKPHSDELHSARPDEPHSARPDEPHNARPTDPQR